MEEDNLSEVMPVVLDDTDMKLRLINVGTSIIDVVLKVLVNFADGIDLNSEVLY